jgi:hypothetical protein
LLALRRILTEPDLANLLSANGKSFARAHLWAEVARQQEQLYFEVVNLN